MRETEPRRLVHLPPGAFVCGSAPEERDLAELEVFLVEKVRKFQEGLDVQIAEETHKAIHASSDEAQLEALRFLHGRKVWRKTDPRIEVAHAMKDLAQSPDPEVRAEVWKLMSGCKEPALKQPLIEAATYDPAFGVRWRAMQGLAAYLPDVEAESVLEEIGATDPDEKVRRAAQAALQGVSYCSLPVETR